VIHARGLARTFKTRRGAVEAVRGVDIDVQPRRAGRLSRAQRRWQDHDTADAHHAAQPDGRHRDRGRRRPAARPHRGAQAHRLRGPGRRAALPALLRELDAADVSLAAMAVHRPTLDDVFLTLTGRALREAEAQADAAAAAASTRGGR